MYSKRCEIAVSVLFLVACLVQSGRAQITVSPTYCLNSSNPCVTTYHYDNNRDGVNPNETTFKASNNNFLPNLTHQYNINLDGQVYAQPLYIHQISGVTGTTGATNVVYVATENNTVYAINADTDAVLISQTLNVNPTDGTETAVPYTDLPGACNNILPEVGITGTPVIDTSVTPPVMWLVSKHEDIVSGVKSYVQKVHGLYTTTLQEIAPYKTVSATGFDAKLNNQRGAVGLFDNPTGTANIYVTWGAHCDSGAYTGFVMEFDYVYSTGLWGTATDVFNTETGTGASEGGVWMSGGAPAASSGNIFFAVGNGAVTSSTQYGNSVVKLNGSMVVQGSYTTNDATELNVGGGPLSCGPTNPAFCNAPVPPATQRQVTLTSGDWDLGSGGVVLLSPTPALSSPELIAAGKQGMLYTLKQSLSGGADTSNPANVACDLTNASVVQCFQAVALTNPLGSRPEYGSRGTPAFWGASGKNFLYMVGTGDVLNAFQLYTSGTSSGTFNTTPIWDSSRVFSYPGASPAVTWNSAGSASDAIVWVLDTHSYGFIDSGGVVHQAGDAILYAYNTTSTSSSASEITNTVGRSNMPGAVKFVVPTIVDGKVLIAGGAHGYTVNSTGCQAPGSGTQLCGQLTIIY